MGFPDAETGGILGARWPEVTFVSFGFGLPSVTSSVEGWPVTGLDDGFLELTTLSSSAFCALSVF